MGAKAQDVVEQTQQKAGEVVDQAKQQATSQLSSQKDRAVDSLGTVADALRQTSKHLRESDQQGIAQYADKAAERVEQFSGQLRGKDVQEIVRDVERYARQQPALFLGGAFVLGLLGARFLKSTAQREDDGDTSRLPIADHTVATNRATIRAHTAVRTAAARRADGRVRMARASAVGTSVVRRCSDAGAQGRAFTR